LSDATRCIEALQLQPHPEGGYFREIYRSPQQVQAGDRIRAASTSIYFLLPKDKFSAWHVVQSDEQWHHYAGEAGASLELHLLQNGEHEMLSLGREIFAGQQPQAMVPAGVVQAARSIGGWVLMGCTVSPGFDFADFALNTAEDLYRDFPDNRDVIDAFLSR
jgi:predicted cupin superfamily sugar epimerase